MRTDDHDRGDDRGSGTIPPPPRGALALTRAIDWVCYGAAGIATLAVLVSLATTGYSVFMRYVLGTPITWIDELSGYLVVAIVMFGAAEALRRDDHIRVDLLTTRLSGVKAQAMKVVWALFIGAVMVALLKSAITAVNFSRDFGIYSQGYMEIPMWIPQSMLIIGSGLVLLAAAGRLVEVLLGVDLDPGHGGSNERPSGGEGPPR